MTATQELSNEFDIFYNNITSNLAPGLDEYEKSVFLTDALDEMIKAYFNPKSNKSMEGFDDSAKRLIDFSSIIENGILNTVTGTSFDPRAILYKLPLDLFISINELLVSNNTVYQIVPITYMEYSRLMSKPYKYPIKSLAWRLITKNAINSSSYESRTENLIIDGVQSLYSITIASNYGKPVKFVLKSVSGITDTIYGNYPKVTETTALVTIICEMQVGIHSSKYWKGFLLNSASRNARNSNIVDIEPYVGNFSTGVNSSIFPSFDVPSTPQTFATIVNPGGNNGEPSTLVEIIGRFSTTPEYRIRYIRRPAPIILTNLPDGLSIHGISTISLPEVPKELYPEIVLRAVELAKAAYTGDLSSMIALGLASETNMGVVSQQKQ